VVGPDVHTLTAIAFPGMPTSETESTSVDGVTYTRTADRFWLQAAGGTGGTSSDPISSALADSDALEAVGTEQHDGITLRSRAAGLPISARTSLA
jgi:hypothetical protein